MTTIDKKKPVLVTGGTGYLASWIVKQLLDQGFHVNTTVRNKANQQKYHHLLDMASESQGQLSIYEADLLLDHSFQEAMNDCELVIHTASPFKISGIKNADKELVQPALQGTRNVLFSANDSKSVKRVVLTSSIVAMMGDAADIHELNKGKLTETDWNTTSSVNHQPYPYSKTMAEKEAWTIVKKQNRWDLVVINPGFILGPSLSRRTDSTSIDLMIQLYSGKFKIGAPAGDHAMVDVRDVAKAHILAGFTPGASGRHLTAAHQKDFLAIAKIVKDMHPAYPVPTKHLAKWLFKLLGPFMGFSRKYVERNVGHDVVFDNSYIQKDLKMSFIPFEKTVIDHFEQLVADGLIPDKR
ncbi:NAD-dependent epimerase/dehydratase family protein [uncultured Sunxiuqinia sp.]|uniref:NAD-dependent epimerase/dehydratase family protein n=1 Tax=uncultured Sunxiuqinia sp. TaxID=1573825 RepID=UPI0030D9683E|tara:strand:+ start:1490 stop:2551 length:1062 start_codon:yes stop_codon:yes gene_type:complete